MVPLGTRARRLDLEAEQPKLGADLRREQLSDARLELVPPPADRALRAFGAPVSIELSVPLARPSGVEGHAQPALDPISDGGQIAHEVLVADDGMIRALEQLRDPTQTRALPGDLVSKEVLVAEHPADAKVSQVPLLALKRLDRHPDVARISEQDQQLHGGELVELQVPRVQVLLRVVAGLHRSTAMVDAGAFGSAMRELSPRELETAS